MFRNPLSKPDAATRPRKASGRRRPVPRLRNFRPRLEQMEYSTLPSTVTWIGGSGDWDTAAN